MTGGTGRPVCTQQLNLGGVLPFQWRTKVLSETLKGWVRLTDELMKLAPAPCLDTPSSGETACGKSQLRRKGITEGEKTECPDD